ncbi:MAG: IPT/TIG domain-containing protein [Prevotellaceae bacterium]|jgi:hypothetical protein|nr:IPT/TIG domain-containing protein [Prevotellaceae bacterium]
MKQKKYIKCAMLLAVFMVAIAAFTACDKEEDNAVLLESFGPTPLLRGETVRFIGSNLNRVTAVVFPTSIEVAPTVVSSSEITAVIPSDAEDGYITLSYPGGSIITKSRITYADGIALDTVAGKADPVRAGDTITITGDNLTSVTQVVFSVDVAVESKNFLTQSRHEITLTLPENAQTGDVYLLAGASESKHKSLNVAGLSITGTSPKAPKPGRDTLLITGTNLDLAVSVIFSGDVTVDAVPVSATQIKAAVPASALNGAVKVVSKAGVEYASPAEVTLLAPTGITTTAARYKAGSEVTISGSDLDLVTGVTFSGGVNAEPTYNATAGSITVTIPATATDGAITLHCVAGDVTTPDITLVKPAIANVAPATIQAGDSITITGTNLDLVTAVKIGGKDGSIISKTETEIKAGTPMDASIAGTGKEVRLTLANGVYVAAAIDVTFPAYCFVLEFPAPEVEIKAGELLRLTVENSSVLTGVNVNGIATQHILQGGTLYVLIPNSASGQTSLKLISGSEKAEYTISVVGAGKVETTIWEGQTDMGSWAGNIQLPANLFSAVNVGNTIKVTVDPASIESSSQGSFKNGSWAAIADGYEYFTITGDFTLEVTADIQTSLQSGGLIISGQLYIATRISIISGGGGSETLWEDTPVETGSWTGYVTLPAGAFAGANAGDKIVVTCSDVAAGAQWGIRDGSWANIVDYADIAGSSYEYAIDAAGLAALQASGGIFTGHDYTITKIELKK